MGPAVHPAEVDALRARMSAAMLALGHEPEAARLISDWRTMVSRPVDWLNAPDELARTLDLEARLAFLQGGQVDHNTGPLHRTGEAHGITTPGDVLAYRATWNDYVMSTARALGACGDAWAAAAAAQTPATELNKSRYEGWPAGVAGPSDLMITDMGGRADFKRQEQATLVAGWNMYADRPDWQIITDAGTILVDFQRIVLKVGQVYRPEIAGDCPKLAEALPPPPSFDVQTQVIARLEGLNVVAHGVLQLIGVGVGGAIETYGEIGHETKTVVEEGVKSIRPVLLAAGMGLAVVLLLAARK